MSKVFLGVGHGGNDPGAVGYVREEDLNLNMALACRDYLVANGVEVQMSRTTDENDDLNEEIKECNAYNPDLAVDIHNNAGGGDGFEAYYSVTGEGKTLAQNLEAEIKAIGQNSRGCKTKWNSKGNSDYYGFIRETKCKAVIVEGVFVDNKADAAQADTLEEQKAFGVAYAKGILKELGINNETKPVQPTEQPKQTLAHKVGETVKINGVYTSSTSDKKLKPAVQKGTITKIIEGARNPYLLNNGNIGWINDDCIVSLEEPKLVKDNTIKLGDKVGVKQGAKSYKGVKLASFVYCTVYDVIQLSGDRAVIGKNGAITTDINVNDLFKV